MHAYSPLEYERRVGGFLVAHLRKSTAKGELVTETVTCAAETRERSACR